MEYIYNEKMNLKISKIGLGGIPIQKVEVDDAKQLNGLKIGEEFDGQIAGLDGYTLKITGGSDKNGFAMKKMQMFSGQQAVTRFCRSLYLLQPLNRLLKI